MDEKVVTSGDQVFDAQTDQKHTYRVLSGVMTITFWVEDASAVESSFPRFTLVSSDGDYKKELTPKDHLASSDGTIQLKFEDLLPGRMYTLTQHHAQSYSENIFTDLAYDRIVDRPVQGFRRSGLMGFSEG